MPDKGGNRALKRALYAHETGSTAKHEGECSFSRSFLSSATVATARRSRTSAYLSVLGAGVVTIVRACLGTGRAAGACATFSLSISVSALEPFGFAAETGKYPMIAAIPIPPNAMTEAAARTITRNNQPCFGAIYFRVTKLPTSGATPSQTLVLARGTAFDDSVHATLVPDTKNAKDHRLNSMRTIDKCHL
jgi:hypothetical protein